MLNRDLRLGLRDWQWVGDGELAPRPARLEITGWPPAVLSDIYLEPANDNLTITGYAPTAGASQFVAPGEDALTLTGHAPVALVDEVVFPDADTLALTGYAPTVTAGVGTNVEPGTDTLTITGEAPTPIVDQVPAPGADTLVVTGYAPLAPASEVVTPGADTLSITEYAPTIDSGAGNTTVEPGTDTLTVTGLAPAISNDIPVGNDTLIITEHAPNVSTDSLVAPGADSLVITGLSPLVSSDQIVAPGTDSLEITEYAPTPVVDQVLAPGVDSLIITEYAPAPVVSQIVAPAQDTLSIVEYAPTVQTSGGNTTIDVANDTLIITEFAPNVSTDTFVAPGQDSVAITGHAPTAVSSQILAPGQDTLTITGQAPIPVVDQVPAPANDTLVITEYAPSIVVDQFVAPAQDSLIITEYAPTVSIGSTGTTHTLIDSAGTYGLPTSMAVPSSSVTEGDLILAVTFDRGGVSHTTHTCSDNHTGTWTKEIGYDNELSDGDARCSMAVWSHIATSTDASSGLTITTDTASSFGGASWYIYSPDSGSYYYVYLGGSGGGTGAFPNDFTTATSSGSTGTLSGSNLLAISIAGGKKESGLAFDATNDVGFSVATEDYTVLDPAGSSGNTYAVAHLDAQSGGTFSDTYDCNNSGIEGIIFVTVFESFNGTSIPVANDTLVMTGYAPTVVVDQRVAPANDTLVITEYAPTVTTESAPQTLTPDGNITTTSFTGGFADIDEATASDTDFAYSANNTNGTLEVSLSNPGTTPGSGSVTVYYRSAQIDSDAGGGPVPDSGGNAASISVSLVQGTTVISTDTSRTQEGSWTDHSWTLTSGEQANITDYNDLRIRFSTSGSGGPAASRRGYGVSWAKVVVPG